MVAGILLTSCRRVDAESAVGVEYRDRTGHLRRDERRDVVMAFAFGRDDAGDD